MKRKAGIKADPVIEEVRRVRAEIWREAGGTAEGLIRLLSERQPRIKRTRPRKKAQR